MKIRREGIKKAIANLMFWVLPGFIFDMSARRQLDSYCEKMDSAIEWSLFKNFAIWPGIVFGGIMLPIYFSNYNKFNDISEQFKENVYQITEVLREKIEDTGFAGKDVVLGTIVVDPATGNVHGLMTYQGVDNYGDKAKFFGRFDANVSKAYAEEYTLSLAEYESLMKKSDNYVSVNTDSKENVQFDTLAIFQENVIASYSNILNLTDGLKNVIENAEGYTVTPIAKACDFNQSLFKNAIYTNPALLSDTNLGLFHVPVQTDYVKNGTALLDVSPVSINEAYDTARFHIDYFEKSGN